MSHRVASGTCPLLLFALGIAGPILIDAQTVVAAGGTVGAGPTLVGGSIVSATGGTSTLSTTAALSSGTAAGNETCSWEGSVSDYLTCEKSSVSTTTLIAAGIGVTLGILLLVGVCVWACQRNTKKRFAASNREEGDVQTVEDGGDELPHPVHAGQYPNEKSASRPPRGMSSDTGTETDSSRSRWTPPPPHPAQLPPGRVDTQASEVVGSPAPFEAPRTLYPRNPSPTPRHLTRPPTSAMRQSAYSRRASMASVRFEPPSAPDHPPMPSNPTGNTRPPVQRAGTQPLQIRKSTVGSPPSRRPSGIPSYYEATQGHPPPPPLQVPAQAPAPTQQTRSASRVSLRPGITRNYTMDGAPPVPTRAEDRDREGNESDAQHPQPEASSRSSGEKGVPEGPRRGSAERGGMI